MDFPRASSHSSFSDLIFRTIPPERVGLDGSYDHNGLAHRVSRSLEEQFGGQLTGALKVKQRGSVVVIIGELPELLLPQLVNVSMKARGATDVEFNGVSLSEPSSQMSLFHLHAAVE